MPSASMFNFVKTGDFVQCFIDDYGKWNETCAERLGNGDTLHLVVESLEFVGGIVGHNQGNDVADNSGEETPPDIVAGKINDCADKCEMPVVPKVDIDRTGRFTLITSEDLLPNIPE